MWGTSKTSGGADDDDEQQTDEDDQQDDQQDDQDDDKFKVTLYLLLLPGWYGTALRCTIVMRGSRGAKSDVKVLPENY